MIIIIDNYDSFTYNLYQYVGHHYNDVCVYKNDDLKLEDLNAKNIKAVIFSPGPGKPANAGKMPEVIESMKYKIPMLGICLGHQAIIENFGGTICNAKEVCHGKVHRVNHYSNCLIFKGISPTFYATRYHSLVASNDSFPQDLEITAKTDKDDEIMAFKHKSEHIYGLQFHPESIETIFGMQMIENFINEIK